MDHASAYLFLEVIPTCTIFVQYIHETYTITEIFAVKCWGTCAAYVTGLGFLSAIFFSPAQYVMVMADPFADFQVGYSSNGNQISRHNTIGYDLFCSTVCLLWLLQ